MIREDFHVHTTVSDGHHSMEEMVQSAIDLGMERIGFSDHSHTSYDLSYCMKKENYPAYLREVRRLREKYEGKIRILAGIEQDYYSDVRPEGFDYVIGAAHYLHLGEEYIDVDWGTDRLRAACSKYFDGDIYALTACYFDMVSGIVEKTSCDLIAHFDLISLYIERDPLFDRKDPRYIGAWKRALDRLLTYGIPFEINTGAIARGYRTGPYPAYPMIDYIKDRGGRLLLSSDSHDKSTLMYRFKDFENLLQG